MNELLSKIETMIEIDNVSIEHIEMYLIVDKEKLNYHKGSLDTLINLKDEITKLNTLGLL